MDIPLQAQVECTDGVCGSSEYVLIHPDFAQVTHLVVKETEAPKTEYIVPFELVSPTEDGKIHLHCSKAELEKMKPFIRTRFVEVSVPDHSSMGPYVMGTYSYVPTLEPEMKTVIEKVEDQQIPTGEMTVQRGTHVEARDGYLGKVDELMVNSKNDQITHLVMRVGHLWAKKEVVVPISTIEETRGDSLLLNIDKRDIESLPAVKPHKDES
jgi:hypothetical protein